MPTTAIVASQILDSGLTGRELIQAADQAAAQAIIGVDPSQYGLLSANNTWTGFNTFQDDLIASFISASSIYTTGSINISEDLEVQGGLIANGAEFSGEVEFTNLITGVGGELQGDLTMSQTADMIVTGGGVTNYTTSALKVMLTLSILKLSLTSHSEPQHPNSGFSPHRLE